MACCCPTTECCSKPLTTLEIAAQCWTDPETSDRVMDEKLATAFAKRLDKERADQGKLYHQRAILLDALSVFVSQAQRKEVPSCEVVNNALKVIRECHSY